MTDPSQKTEASAPAGSIGLSFPGSNAFSTGQALQKYMGSFLIVAAVTLPGYWLRQTLDTATIAMFYLLALVGIAFWLGRGPAVAASFLISSTRLISVSPLPVSRTG
jgi:hypothetical protein